MSLVATRMQDWRLKSPLFDKNMTRPSEYGALDFFARQTESQNSIIPPSVRQASIGSMGNTIKIPVINYDAGVTVSNVRNCVIADNENTSALFTVVYATYAIGFTMVPALFMNNDIDYDHDYSRKMEKITRALANALDAAAVTALDANKTQVFRDALNYPVVGNAIQAGWDERTEILGDINPIMRANDYPGQIHLVANAGVDSIIRKLAQHGYYNDVNKQLEYFDKVFHYTNNVVNDPGNYGTFFAVEDGNVAVLTRVDREAYRGSSSGTHQFGQVRLPMLEIPVGYHYYEEVGDQSRFEGAPSPAPVPEYTQDMTCNIKEFYGFSVDVAFIVAYNSNPAIVANPIIKGEIESGSNRVARPVRVVSSASEPIYTAQVS